MLIGLAFALLYQNCAPPAAEEDFSSQGTDDTPFAFDIKMDTIAHMTCTATNAATFTFKLGAYLDGNGIGLSQEFMDYVGTDRPEQLLEVLRNSENNSVAQPQAAVRNSSGTNPYLSLYSVGGSNTHEIMGPLGADHYATSLALSGERRIRFFRRVASAFDRNVEFRMGAMGSLANLMGLRTQLEQGGQLTASFVDYQQPNSAPLAPDPQEAGFRAYGRGYQLGFQADSNFEANHRRRMVSVTTKNMLDQSTIPEQWNCVHYRVIRLRDWQADPSLCPISTDPAPTENRNSLHEFTRRVLDPTAQHWYIHTREPAVAPLNVANCIVPKAPVDTCYGNGNNEVIYGSQACDDTDQDGTNQCPHYLSICSLGL